MFQTFTIIFPIFAIIFAGYITVRQNIIEQSNISALGKFVIYIALPSTIISKVSEQDLTQAINSNFMFTYALGSLSAYGFAFTFTILVLKKSQIQGAVNGHGASFSNSSFLIFPILYQTIGDLAIGPFIMALLVENILLMPFVLGMNEHAHLKKQNIHFLKKLATSIAVLAKHPIILSVCIGTVLNFLHIKIPLSFSGTLDLVASSTAAVALFYIGASLVGIKIRNDLSQISFVTFSKLIIHPLSVGLLGYFVFELDLFNLCIAVLFGSASVMSIYPILCEKYGMNAYCSAVVLLSTLLSPVGIFVMLYLLPK